MKISEEEYQELRERVEKGKKILDGHWWENKEWTELWFELSGFLFEQAKLRGEFNTTQTDWPKSRPIGETPDEYIARIRNNKSLFKLRGKSILKQEALEKLFA